MKPTRALGVCALLLAVVPAMAIGYQSSNHFELLDVFELEWVSDPQISPARATQAHPSRPLHGPEHAS